MDGGLRAGGGGGRRRGCAVGRAGRKGAAAVAVGLGVQSTQNREAGGREPASQPSQQHDRPGTERGAGEQPSSGGTSSAGAHLRQATSDLFGPVHPQGLKWAGGKSRSNETEPQSAAGGVAGAQSWTSRRRSGLSFSAWPCRPIRQSIRRGLPGPGLSHMPAHSRDQENPLAGDCAGPRCPDRYWRWRVVALFLE